jgi:hypothetical protein
LLGRLVGRTREGPGRCRRAARAGLNLTADTAVVLAFKSFRDEETVRLIHHIRDEVVLAVVGDGLRSSPSAAALPHSSTRASMALGGLICRHRCGHRCRSCCCSSCSDRCLVAGSAAKNVLATIGAAYGVMAVALQGGVAGG